MNSSHRIVAFTDGACSGNPGPGGWASIIVYGNSSIEEMGGKASQDTTNNRMEIMGPLQTLARLQDTAGLLTFYTDSVYVIRGITQWVKAWVTNGWITASGQPVANEDLWKLLHTLVTERETKFGPIEWTYVPGHSGVVGNERADHISVLFSRGLPVNLYCGPLSEYKFDILNLDINKDSKQYEKPIYLSLVNKVLTRHENWADCEKHVKGKKGAKFKKVLSKLEEEATLNSWNIHKTEHSPE